MASFSSAAFSYKGLLSDGDDVTTRTGSVAAGVFTRGTIVAIDPATGAIAAATAATGNAIMAQDVDASGGAQTGLVYMTGKFKADAITWPSGSKGTIADNLRKCGIVIEAVVGTDGLTVKTQAAEGDEEKAEKGEGNSEAGAHKTAPPHRR